jgi:hypothetical protein
LSRKKGTHGREIYIQTRRIRRVISDDSAALPPIAPDRDAGVAAKPATSKSLATSGASIHNGHCPLAVSQLISRFNMRFQLFCGALLGLVFRWSNPLIAKTAALLLSLIVIEGFTQFIQHRRRFSRLVDSYFLIGLTPARSSSQSPLGAYEVHGGTS